MVRLCLEDRILQIESHELSVGIENKNRCPAIGEVGVSYRQHSNLLRSEFSRFEYVTNLNRSDQRMYSRGFMPIKVAWSSRKHRGLAAAYRGAAKEF